MKSRITLFITGASVMILQVIGVRLIAIELGTTISVWAAMIAVTISALALGYYAGGTAADREVPSGVIANGTQQKMRALFVIGAGIGVALILPLKMHIFEVGTFLPYGIRAILVSIVLFFIPTMLLAITTMYTTRMESSSMLKIGSTSGTLYAISTLGSLVGVFVTSFYLIPHFGISTILYTVATILFLTGITLRVTS